MILRSISINTIPKEKKPNRQRPKSKVLMWMKRSSKKISKSKMLRLCVWLTRLSVRQSRRGPAISILSPLKKLFVFVSGLTGLWWKTCSWKPMLTQPLRHGLRSWVVWTLPSDGFLRMDGLRQPSTAKKSICGFQSCLLYSVKKLLFGFWAGMQLSSVKRSWDSRQPIRNSLKIFLRRQKASSCWLVLQEAERQPLSTQRSVSSMM